MYVYSMLDNGTNAKLQSKLGFVVKSEREGTPDASIIVRKNSSGGVDSPVAYIMDPGKTVVIAGASNDAGMDFAEIAAEAGVPEENIFFAPLSLRDLAIKLDEILTAGESPAGAKPSAEARPPAKRIEQPEEIEPVAAQEEEPIEEDDSEPKWAEPPQSRVKTIAVIGFRGGVGRSTVATSLADHFRGSGEVVAIVDLGSPPTAYRHFGFKEIMGDSRDGFIVLKGKVDIYVPEVPVYDYPGDALVKVINELKKEYRRVIIDYPAEPRQSHLDIDIDCPVIVIDHDMVLSVKNGIDGVYVYNKAVPEVPDEVVGEILRSEPVVIKMDIEYCIAALVSGETAYQSSGIVAEGIGNLAARIG